MELWEPEISRFSIWAQIRFTTSSTLQQTLDSPVVLFNVKKRNNSIAIACKTIHYIMGIFAEEILSRVYSF